MAIKTVGLWGDAEKTFLLSKPYLDKLWQTIDDVAAQEKKAQELMQQLNKQNTPTNQLNNQNIEE